MGLFKDNITKTGYRNLIEDLRNALNNGADALKFLLLGTMEPDLYSEHGKYEEGQHNGCDGLKGDRYREKRLCKCMYYYNQQYEKKCDECDIEYRYKIVGDYEIIDYEVPAFYYGKGIGEIDLVLRSDDLIYATEVKPYKGNSETLLRMVAEIMTYTLGYSDLKYKKAIAFFEESPQEKEYLELRDDMKALINEAEITVFRFKKVDEETYRICKLDTVFGN